VTYTLAGMTAGNVVRCWVPGAGFQSATPCTPVAMTLSGSRYESADIPQSSMSDGTYRVVVVVTDGAGNSTSSTVNFTIS
jgi:hypothetical protein